MRRQLICRVKQRKTQWIDGHPRPICGRILQVLVGPRPDVVRVMELRRLFRPHATTLTRQNWGSAYRVKTPPPLREKTRRRKDPSERERKKEEREGEEKSGDRHLGGPHACLSAPQLPRSLSKARKMIGKRSQKGKSQNSYGSGCPCSGRTRCRQGRCGTPILGTYSKRQVLRCFQ